MLKIMIHKYSYGKGYSTVDIEVYEKELTIKSDEYGYFLQFDKGDEFLNILELIEINFVKNEWAQHTETYFKHELEAFKIDFDINVPHHAYTIQSLANEDHRLYVSLNEWIELLATLYTIRAVLFR